MYNLLHLLFRTLFSLFFRWQVSGADKIPVTGGVIIAANHISLWDPPVIGAAITRQIHFMAKEQLFANTVFAWLISRLGAFPVRRGMADRTAIRTALSLLEDGKVLGLFPEGTRSKTGKLGRPEPGLAMLAVKAGVPVVPTAIIGTNNVFREGKLLPKFKIIFGKPLIFTRDNKDGLADISGKIMEEIDRLLNEEKHNRNIAG